MIVYSLSGRSYCRLQVANGVVFHSSAQSHFWAIVSAMAKAYKAGFIK